MMIYYYFLLVNVPKTEYFIWELAVGDDDLLG